MTVRDASLGESGSKLTKVGCHFAVIMSHCGSSEAYTETSTSPQKYIEADRLNVVQKLTDKYYYFD